MSKPWYEDNPLIVQEKDLPAGACLKRRYNAFHPGPLQPEPILGCVELVEGSNCWIEIETEEGFDQPGKRAKPPRDERLVLLEKLAHHVRTRWEVMHPIGGVATSPVPLFASVYDIRRVLKELAPTDPPQVVWPK